MYIANALSILVQNILMADVSNKFAKNLRTSISEKINKLPLRYYDLHSKGDILSRVTNDVDTIAQSMNQSLATLVTSTFILDSIYFCLTLLMFFFGIKSALFMQNNNFFFAIPLIPNFLSNIL